VQQGLSLTRSAEQIAGFAMPAKLRQVPARSFPPGDLA
jgi:hypothetical protein